ncbi:MAG: tetratricopeptide repeat protein [Saccharothrix sp.]|nr:tetratricopeptide repeat protein [Saccharothrix sp.]
MEGIQRAEVRFGGTAEQALRDINHTVNHYHGDRTSPITSGTSVAPPLGRLDHEVRGRSELVVAVTDALGGSIAVLTAGGGFGKTTVALEVVRRLPRVWWVDASSRDGLVAGLAEVALRAGADSHEVRQAWAGRGGSAIDLLWRELDRRTEPWVLVFDNADDPDVLAASGGKVGDGNGWLRSPGPAGSIIVTSRAGAGWPPAAHVHQVGRLGPEDGAQVLLDLAAAGDRRDAAALSRRLGGLPLALRLAGRYLAVATGAPALPGLDSPTTFKAYQERWDERFSELTEEEPTSPRESLSRTWEMSMDLLAARGRPRTRQLLRLISTFTEAPVPAFVLDAAVMAESDLLDGITAARLSVLLKALREVGLLDVGGSSVVVHPVIRDANRHQPDFERDGRAYRALVVRLLRAAIGGLDSSDPATWPRWRAVLPHLADLDASGDPEVDLATAGLLHEGGRVTAAVGSYATAESLCRRAVALSTLVVGVDHGATLVMRHALAHVLQDAGALTGAEREHRSLIADQERLLGADDPVTLDSRKCLAKVLRGLGRWDEAEAGFREVLASRARTRGPTDREALRARHDLGDLLEARGKLAEAETEHRSVVRAMEEHLGADDDEVMHVRLCLSGVLQGLGLFDRAEAEIRDVIEVFRRRRGRAGSLPPRLHFELAVVLHESGRLAEAESEYRAAIAGNSAVVGTEHPGTLGLRRWLGQVLADRGDLAAGEEEHVHVIEAQRRLIGPTHPDTLRTRSWLAQIHSSQGRLDEAEAGYRDVLSILERTSGPEDVQALVVRHRLGHTRAKRGDLVAAERDHRHVVTARERVLGPLHPSTLTSRHCLAGLLCDQGRHDEAEAEYRVTAELRARVLGPGHRLTLDTRTRLAEVLTGLGRHDEAEAEYRAVLDAEGRTSEAEQPGAGWTRGKPAAFAG